MGLSQAAIPASFILISIFGIAIGASSIKTYRQLEASKKVKSTLNFAITIVVVSIIGLLISGYFVYKSFTSGDAASEEAASGNFPNTQAAKNAIPTTEQILQLATTNNVRKAEGRMDAEIDKLVSSLTETRQTKNAQLQARLAGLIAAAQALSAASAGAT